MDTEQLIELGNQAREDNNPELALSYYAQAMTQDRKSASAFNNYGNVLRECGDPEGAIPFLQRAITLDPNNATANFNLAVAYLLAGNYKQGWQQYETRWHYEHLAGTAPTFAQPRWRGEDLKDKTILVVGEQGHGDCIQFSRFIFNLHAMGAKVKLQVTDGLIPLLGRSNIIENTGRYNQDMGEFDYWVPIMSLPGILGITLENLPNPVSYLNASTELTKTWLETLGPKTKMRVGISWSGRRDSWLNQHKGMPFDKTLELIRSNPQYEWYNLQIDATEDESLALSDAGVRMFPGSVGSFADTAALLMHMDVVLSVDTAIAHLSGALGRPTWIMLNWFAVDWRWLLNKDSSPWYSTARLFRQDGYGNWDSVIKKITQYLSWFKV